MDLKPGMKFRAGGQLYEVESVHGQGMYATIVGPLGFTAEVPVAWAEVLWSTCDAKSREVIIGKRNRWFQQYRNQDIETPPPWELADMTQEEYDDFIQNEVIPDRLLVG